MHNQQTPPQQHRLEGPNLEDLLSEVRERFGRHATIVEANRLRRGGVAGFFSREQFEVVVEGDELAPPATAATPDAPAAPPVPGPRLPLEPPAVASILDWADRVSDGESVDDDVDDRADDHVADDAPAAPSLSTQGSAFADVLARIAHDAALTPADAADDDPSAAFEAWPGAEALIERLPMAQPAAPVDPDPGPVPAPAASTGPLPEPRPARVAAHSYGLVPAPTTPVSAAPPQAPPLPAPAPATVAAPAPAPLADATPALDVTPLVQAGLPAELAARGAGEADLRKALVHALEHVTRPEALPDLPGAVIAVVGARTEALALAGRIAGELRLDPQAVLFATPRSDRSGHAPHLRIDSLAAATERRLGWRRRQHPTVVVLEAETLRRDGDWACEMLDALEVTMTCATVDATRKPEDVAAWAAALGGIDALAVNGLDDTVSPAAVLDAGVPVGWIDGEHATPSQWAAVLTERLVAA